MSILELKSSFVNLSEHIEYPSEGILSKVLLKDKNCQYTLFCLAKILKFLNIPPVVMRRFMSLKEKES